LRSFSIEYNFENFLLLYEMYEVVVDIVVCKKVVVSSVERP
jgi:hypothetical protein